jgi:hypothetical protein
MPWYHAWKYGLGRAQSLLFDAHSQLHSRAPEANGSFLHFSRLQPLTQLDGFQKSTEEKKRPWDPFDKGVYCIEKCHIHICRQDVP